MNNIKEIEANIKLYEEEDFECAITGGFMFLPAKSQNCDHIFEKEALDEWLSEHKTCPTCRKKTTKSVCPPQNCIDAFTKILELKKEDYAGAKWYSARAASLKAYLREVKYEETPGWDALILWYVMCTQNHWLAPKIQKTENESLLYLFVTTRNGYNFLKNDKTLCELLCKTITKEGLNGFIHTNHHDGEEKSMLWAIAKVPTLHFLLENEILRGKITYNGLMLRLENDMSVYDWLYKFKRFDLLRILEKGGKTPPPLESKVLSSDKTISPHNLFNKSKGKDHPFEDLNHTASKPKFSRPRLCDGWD